MSSSFLRDFYRRYYGKEMLLRKIYNSYYGETVSSLVERHAFVEVIGSSPILVLFYFFINLRKGDF